MKKILVLGGTMFVGRSLVEMLRTKPEYEVTLFNRGKSNAGLFPDVNQVHGNRETDDILQICNQNWDCIIDFSGYYPVTFEKLLASLEGKVGRYIFISTISVYDLGKFGEEAITETDAIYDCSEIQKTSKLPDAYGEKKAEMERILHGQEWLDKIILRPSFIYGKYDWTERFYYWFYRAKFFKRVLIPEDFSFSLTYAGDLANAILNAIETKQHNTVYNTISQSNITIRNVVNTSSIILNRSVQFADASNALLEKNQLTASVFPLFVPINFTIEGSRWLKDFSVTPTNFRTAIDTTIRYYDSLGWPIPNVGLTVEQEKQILGV